MVYVLAPDGSALAHFAAGDLVDDTPGNSVAVHFPAARRRIAFDYRIDPPLQLATALAAVLREEERIDARVEDRRRKRQEPPEDPSQPPRIY